MRRVALDGLHPSEDALRAAASVIARGGVVAFPTDTLYGLAVDPFDAAATKRLFDVKGRAAGQAIALVAADREQVEAWFGALTAPAARLADRFWPGPLTILLDARLKPSRYADGDGRSAKALAERLAPGIAAADGTVGIRVPDHAVARGFCRASMRPLTATSANLSGQAPSADPDEAARALDDRIDLLLDAGRTSGGPPSTLVDATGRELRLVRAGAIDWETIQRCASPA